MIKKLTPLQWVIIGVCVLGGAGLIYWLLQPTKPKPSTGTPTGGTSLTGSNLNSGARVGFVATGDEFTSPVDGTDQGGGNYTNNPDWIIGNYGALQGQDFQGFPFVTSAAPIIPFEAKDQPYFHGIDYDFPEQTALSIANWNRFPEFSLSDVKIHSMGPWYSNPSANEIFKRGITTITGLPGFRSGPTSTQDLPQTQKNWMCPDDVLWEQAGSLAASVGADDPIYATLMKIHDHHYFDIDEAAFKKLGEHVWMNESIIHDARGEGMRYMSLDIESSDPASYPNWNTCMGHFYDGFCGAAAAAGVTVRPYTYGGPQQTTIEPYSSIGGSGLPNYLNDEHDFLSNVDEKVAAVVKYGGVLAVDTYQQGVWGEQDFYVRDGSGTPQLDGNGHPIFQELSQTVVYGMTIPLEAGEAQKCLRDIYQQSTRLYLQNHRVAGQYPHMKGLRREGFQAAQVGAFTRYTGEGMEGVLINDRPLPPWLIEMFNSLNMFLAPQLWCWGVDFNNTPDEPGTNHSNVWQYQAHGVAEFIMKAAHRHSAFTNIQNSNFKWAWFNLAIVDNTMTDGNRYDQKAIIHAKIRDVNSAVFVEFLFAFPGSDSRPTPITFTVNQGGVVSTWNFELKSGRKVFYDCWRLPSSFSYDQLEGANLTVSYPDVLGVTRSFKGDYRQNQPLLHV